MIFFNRIGLHKKSGKLVFLGLDNAGKVKKNIFWKFHFFFIDWLDDFITHVERWSTGSTCPDSTSKYERILFDWDIISLLFVASEELVMGNMKFTTFDLGGHAQGNEGFFCEK